MNRKLEEIAHQLLITNNKILTGVDYNKIPAIMNNDGSLLYNNIVEQILNIRGGSIHDKWYLEWIADGEVQKFLKCNLFEFRKLEEIKKVLDVFCKTQKAEYEVINSDIIKLTIDNLILENKEIYWIAITKKGIAMLNNFLKINKASYDTVKLSTWIIKVEEVKLCGLPVPPTITRELYELTLVIEVSNIKKLEFKQKITPDIIKKIYIDIKPIVSKFFLRDFSLDNIYYDINQKKYIIFGITDFLEYKSDTINIDLNSLFSKNSLYFFKETQLEATFEEYLISQNNFFELKGWWELC